MTPSKKLKTLLVLTLLGMTTVLSACKESVWYKDVDEDGFSDGTSVKQAERPTGHFLQEELLAVKGDCDDGDATVFPRLDGEGGRSQPGGGEICDGRDNDCSGKVDDGLGQLCSQFSETLVLPKEAVRAGEPIWVTAVFTNHSGKPIETIRPDCFNTTFTLQDDRGRILPPQYRMRQAYGIPDDVINFPHADPADPKSSGAFRIACDLTESYPAEVLIPDSPDSKVTSVTYRVQATYSNFIRDPDIDPSGQCREGVKCYTLWTGGIASGSKQTITILGPPLDRRPATVSFEPAVWDVQWASREGGRVQASIRDIDLASIDLRNPDIRLNGAVPILKGSAKVSGDALTVEFDASEAVDSLGTLILPLSNPAYPVIDINTEKAVFSGKAAVRIQPLAPAGQVMAVQEAN